jgi:hypothetical protein
MASIIAAFLGVGGALGILLLFLVIFALIAVVFSALAGWRGRGPRL